METEPILVAAGDRLRQPLTECRLVFLVKKTESKRINRNQNASSFNPCYRFRALVEVCSNAVSNEGVSIPDKVLSFCGLTP